MWNRSGSKRRKDARQPPGALALPKKGCTLTPSNRRPGNPIAGLAHDNHSRQQAKEGYEKQFVTCTPNPEKIIMENNLEVRTEYDPSGLSSFTAEAATSSLNGDAFSAVIVCYPRTNPKKKYSTCREKYLKFKDLMVMKGVVK
jgi:hypothetical protein